MCYSLWYNGPTMLPANGDTPIGARPNGAHRLEHLLEHIYWSTSIITLLLAHAYRNTPVGTHLLEPGPVEHTDWNTY